MTRYHVSIIDLKDEVRYFKSFFLCKYIFVKKILFWTNCWFFKAVGFVDRAFAILHDENLENQWSL